jgi:quinol monooxygenase YgiN
MPKVAVIAKLTAAEGKRDDLQAALADMGMRNVAGEPGTLIYSLNTDTRDPNVLWFFELYEDGDALAAHGGSEGMKELGKAIGSLVGAKTEIHVLDPVAAKGLDL